MKINILPFVAVMMSLTACGTDDPKGLKDVFDGQFLIGTALNEQQILHQDPKADSLIALHFNAIVAENCMKHESVHPSDGVYTFDLADKFVQYGIDNNLTITGHCLVWHSQCAPWFFVDEQGNEVSADVLKERMKEHIYTVVGRYKGKILGWDVVNEAIMEDGSYRQSPYYRILGEEFIPWAFQCAHEADPDAELYYNDYNMYEPGKRATVVKLIEDLKARGLRIDAVGMQTHIGMDYPDLAEYEASIQAYIAAGVNVMSTEFDLSALPQITMSADVNQTFAMFPRPGRPGEPMPEMTEEQKAAMDSIMAAFNAKFNPYTEGLPEEVSQAWNDRVMQFINLYRKYSDHFTRLTAWGLTDAVSWKNTFMAVRTDYPLFFDREYKAKPFVEQLISECK